MTIGYIKGDLFAADSEYCLAHCISADLALGAGIAKQFTARLDMKNRLKTEYGDISTGDRVGRVFTVDRVFNLVTKSRYFHKPTYETLKMCLEEMRDIMEQQDIKRLAMPKIGCGLDRLEWGRVESIIGEVFGGLMWKLRFTPLTDRGYETALFRGFYR